MSADILSLSPFSSPRAKVDFKKFAILLKEAPESSEEVKKDPLSARSLFSQEILPKTTEDNVEDAIGTLGELLQTKIKAYTGGECTVFNAEKIKKKHVNSPTLVPLMYRIATEDFIKYSKDDFKIIECRNTTKLNSDWKPSLSDTLIASKHQVIEVQLQGSFLPYNDFAYAVLRQIDYNWSMKLPRSIFYPNDVCKVEALDGRNHIIVTPSMPDGDLEVSKKMSNLNYELIMMFKKSCMSALKNHLLMKDLRIGKFQNTDDSVTAIRSIYKQLQERVRSGDFQMGSNSPEDIEKFIKEQVAAKLEKVGDKEMLNMELSALDDVMDKEFQRIRSLIAEADEKEGQNEGEGESQAQLKIDDLKIHGDIMQLEIPTSELLEDIKQAVNKNQEILSSLE